ncbi:hypothetical protein FC18_GL001502 [Lacticaseibacillus sharpeae JCM 1186 = DSM 20505]|uniref:Uncharacterized protein n=2 Tax=Lacticaseibacillus sharpeae TaxID=1626 RepID=A0A0R1ZLJ7_9LACO|nr:hypothetical protein FC18_GL001502 [Lacticaseibacillus sharpeae JCM 1186 = DSM 20505]
MLDPTRNWINGQYDGAIHYQLLVDKLTPLIDTGKIKLDSFWENFSLDDFNLVEWTIIMQIISNCVGLKCADVIELFSQYYVFDADTGMLVRQMMTIIGGSHDTQCDWPDLETKKYAKIISAAVHSEDCEVRKGLFLGAISYCFFAFNLPMAILIFMISRIGFCDKQIGTDFFNKIELHGNSDGSYGVIEPNGSQHLANSTSKKWQLSSTVFIYLVEQIYQNENDGGQNLDKKE